ncbi:MAG: Triosephosphate isomerase [Chlamydiae bacterium]|nr:Triosephosphate isomerase [Chlamydiota bacterium]
MPRKSARNKQNRPVIITGNWKMYKTIEEAAQFVEALTPLIKQSPLSAYLSVPFTAIHSTAELVKKLDAPIVIGAQNMHDASEGAFTGEIAAKMLKDAGAEFVILGHSERRHIFHESNSFINRKVKKAIAEDLQPILCIGETLEQRESGKVEETLKSQLLESLKEISAKDLEKVVIAYEPVWAIGTGKVANADDAEKAHLFCRKVIAEKWSQEDAAVIPILYGGSVKPDNAGALLAEPDIDGLLVGGASLSPENFSQIINSFKV